MVRSRKVPSLSVLALLSALAGCDAGTSGLPPVADPPPGTLKQGMTWYKDVLPIVQTSCQGCHSPGGVAPFPLMTYEDGRMYAQPMASAVAARRMPPWLPSADCQRFTDSRALSQDAIDTITSWAQTGAAEGSAADAPTAPPPTPVDLAWSDVTLDPGESFTPTSKSGTDYHCYVLDPKLAQEQSLIGFAVTPGDRTIVHHVLLYPADAAEARALDDKEPGLGYTCYGGPGTKNRGTIGGWVPGAGPVRFPEGIGIPLAAGSAMVMQIHYDNHGAGAWRPDRTTVRLQYARQAVKRAQVLPLLNPTFSVPPGAQGYEVTATRQVAFDGIIYGVQPHAHQAATRLRVDADQCLIDLPRWDFSWQQMYFYEGGKGIPVKRGTELKLTCVYNNPGTEPLRWGESTADEMCLSYFFATAN